MGRSVGGRKRLSVNEGSEHFLGARLEGMGSLLSVMEEDEEEEEEEREAWTWVQHLERIHSYLLRCCSFSSFSTSLPRSS